MSATENWHSLRERNNENIMRILGTLSDREQAIWQDVIKYERDNRHIHSPEYRVPLKRIIELNIRSVQSGEE